MIALWVARRHGLPVDDALLQVAESFRKTQRPAGTWSYQYLFPPQIAGGDPNMRPRASMTCAGLLGLALGHGVAKKNKEALPPILQDSQVKMGIKVIGDFLKDPNPFASPLMLGLHNTRYYFLFSMERMAMVYDIDKIGDTEWYVWGAEHLLDWQGGDGGWGGEVETCFALLFLRRANVAADLTLDLKGIARDGNPPPRTPAGSTPKRNSRERDPFDVPQFAPKEKEKKQSTTPAPGGKSLEYKAVTPSWVCQTSNADGTKIHNRLAALQE
jgi:hypothetical protein